MKLYIFFATVLGKFAIIWQMELFQSEISKSENSLNRKQFYHSPRSAFKDYSSTSINNEAVHSNKDGTIMERNPEQYASGIPNLTLSMEYPTFIREQIEYPPKNNGKQFQPQIEETQNHNSKKELPDLNELPLVVPFKKRKTVQKNKKTKSGESNASTDKYLSINTSLAKIPLSSSVADSSSNSTENPAKFQCNANQEFNNKKENQHLLIDLNAPLSEKDDEDQTEISSSQRDKAQFSINEEAQEEKTLTMEEALPQEKKDPSQRLLPYKEKTLAMENELSHNLKTLSIVETLPNKETTLAIEEALPQREKTPAVQQILCPEDQTSVAQAMSLSEKNSNSIPHDSSSSKSSSKKKLHQNDLRNLIQSIRKNGRQNDRSPRREYSRGQNLSPDRNRRKPYRKGSSLDHSFSRDAQKHSSQDRSQRDSSTYQSRRDSSPDRHRRHHHPSYSKDQHRHSPPDHNQKSSSLSKNQSDRNLSSTAPDQSQRNYVNIQHHHSQESQQQQQSRSSQLNHDHEQKKKGASSLRPNAQTSSQEPNQNFPDQAELTTLKPQNLHGQPVMSVLPTPSGQPVNVHLHPYPTHYPPEQQILPQPVSVHIPGQLIHMTSYLPGQHVPAQSTLYGQSVLLPQHLAGHPVHVPLNLQPTVLVPGLPSQHIQLPPHLPGQPVLLPEMQSQPLQLAQIEYNQAQQNLHQELQNEEQFKHDSMTFNQTRDSPQHHVININTYPENQQAETHSTLQIQDHPDNPFFTNLNKREPAENHVIVIKPSFPKREFDQNSKPQQKSIDPNASTLQTNSTDQNRNPLQQSSSDHHNIALQPNISANANPGPNVFQPFDHFKLDDVDLVIFVAITTIKHSAKVDEFPLLWQQNMEQNANEILALINVHKLDPKNTAELIIKHIRIVQNLVGNDVTILSEIEIEMAEIEQKFLKNLPTVAASTARKLKIEFLFMRLFKKSLILLTERVYRNDNKEYAQMNWLGLLDFKIGSVLVMMARNSEKPFSDIANWVINLTKLENHIPLVDLAILLTLPNSIQKNFTNLAKPTKIQHLFDIIDKDEFLAQFNLIWINLWTDPNHLHLIRTKIGKNVSVDVVSRLGEIFKANIAKLKAHHSSGFLRGLNQLAPKYNRMVHRRVFLELRWIMSLQEFDTISVPKLVEAKTNGIAYLDGCINLM